MRYFVVVDTNVLVSAMLAGSKPSPTKEIMLYIFSGSIVPLFNDEIIKEYEDVLNREKFGFIQEDVRFVIDNIRQKGLYCDQTFSTMFFPDVKDKVFYEIALSKEDSYLVTGNTRHFPVVPRVVTPAEMVLIVKNTTQ